MNKAFNLLLLHSRGDVHPRTWICIKGPKIKYLLRRMEKDALQCHRWSRERLSRDIAAHFNCAHGVVKRVLQGNIDFYPIPIILELAKLGTDGKKTLKQIQDNITYLKVNSASAKPVKAARGLSRTLAKILGAFMADGSLSIQYVVATSEPERLYGRKKILDSKKIHYSTGYVPSRKQHYVSIQASRENRLFLERLERSNDLHIQSHYSIELTEEYKDSVEAFNRWLKEEFDIQPTGLGRKKGAWRTIFSNKILARYLMTFFEVVPGLKTYTAHEPERIKKSSLSVRKSFARGVLMFDGSVSKNHKISFSSKSEKLRESIKEIWEADKLSFCVSSNQPRREYTIVTTENNNKKKYHVYFEPGTQKDKLLWWLAGDLRYKPLIKVVEGLSADNLLSVIRKRGACDIGFLEKYFNRRHTTILHYVNILKRQKRICLSKQPKQINDSMSENIGILLGDKQHEFLFKSARDILGRDKNLARVLNIHKATFSAWRKRKSRIPLHFIRQACRVLDLECDEIVSNNKGVDRRIVEMAN